MVFVYCAMDWWLAQVSSVVGRKRLFPIPRDPHERAVQPQVWQRSRGSGVRGSLKLTKMYESYVTSSGKVCGRYYLLDRNDVVKLLRWDLLEVGWLRLGRSLFKPLDVGFTQGSPGSHGGCVTTLCFLE